MSIYLFFPLCIEKRGKHRVAIYHRQGYFGATLFFGHFINSPLLVLSSWFLFSLSQVGIGIRCCCSFNTLLSITSCVSYVSCVARVSHVLAMRFPDGHQRLLQWASSIVTDIRRESRHVFAFTGFTGCVSISKKDTRTTTTTTILTNPTTTKITIRIESLDN